jgi:hypothetical protein
VAVEPRVDLAVLRRERGRHPDLPRDQQRIDWRVSERVYAASGAADQLARLERLPVLVCRSADGEFACLVGDGQKARDQIRVDELLDGSVQDQHCVKHGYEIGNDGLLYGPGGQPLKFVHQLNKFPDSKCLITYDQIVFQKVTQNSHSQDSKWLIKNCLPIAMREKF